MTPPQLHSLYHFARTHWLARRLQTRQQVVAWQQRQWHRFQQNILVRSPFYKGYVGQPLEHFPIISKKIMMDHLSDINTRSISHTHALDVALAAENSRDFSPTIGDVCVGLSSGTSGHRGLFLVSAQERAQWAGVMLAKVFSTLQSSLQLITKPHRIAFFLRANSRLYETLGRTGRLTFSFFDLMTPMEDLCEKVSAFQPTILVAPARVLRHLADHQSTLGLHPTRIFSVAEVLDPLDAQIIEKAFSRQVHQIYQATEGFLGITASDDSLRLNEEFMIIEREWVDQKSGRFIPIITDFTRTTQPIIRYRLDDILVEDQSWEAKEAPFTHLKMIEGRCDDVFYSTDLNGNSKPIFPDQLRHFIATLPFCIHDYHLGQQPSTQIIASFSPKLSVNQELLFRSLFENFCLKNKMTPLNVQFHAYTCSSSFSAKKRRIQRVFS